MCVCVVCERGKGVCVVCVREEKECVFVHVYV